MRGWWRGGVNPIPNPNPKQPRRCRWKRRSLDSDICALIWAAGPGARILVTYLDPYPQRKDSQSPRRPRLVTARKIPADSHGYFCPFVKIQEAMNSYGQPPSAQGYGQPASGPKRLSPPGAGFWGGVQGVRSQPLSPVRSTGPQPLSQPVSPVKIQQQALFGSPNKTEMLVAQQVEVVKPPPAGGLEMAMYAVRMRERRERDEKERVVQTTPDLLLPCPLRCNRPSGSV